MFLKHKKDSAEVPRVPMLDVSEKTPRTMSPSETIVWRSIDLTTSGPKNMQTVNQGKALRRARLCTSAISDRWRTTL